MNNYTANSSQSIYNNALPIYKNRIDLCNLDHQGPDFADQLLDGLFSQNLNLQIEGNEVTTKRLKHLFFETKNYERTQGARTLGVGYPLYLSPSEQKINVAPLFIWTLILEPSQTSLDQWVIKSPNQQFPEINQTLIKLFENNKNTAALQHIKELINNQAINKKNLFTLGEKLMSQLNIKQYGSSETTIPALGIDVIGAIPAEGALQWSGVMGIFPSQLENKTLDITELTEHITAQKMPQKKENHPFGLLPTDPYQATAIAALRQEKIVVIEGEKGSGKTHTLTQLLTNALSNGQKCLVVSDSVEKLKKAQSYLVKAVGTQNNFLIKDARYDKSSLIEILRSAATRSEQEANFTPPEYNLHLSQIRRVYDQLETQYQSVRQPIFGDKNRTELIGHYLRSNKEVGKELLNSKLHTNDFLFSEKEYTELKKGILMSHVLYEKVDTLSHPLTNLHPHIFLEKEDYIGQQYTTESATIFIEKAKKLHRKFISSIDIYTGQLIEYYDRHYREFALRVKSIKAQISDNQQKHGDTFERLGEGNLRVQSLFSSKKRAILKDKKEVFLAYDSLISSFAERSYFDFSFEEYSSNKIKNISQNIDTFSNELVLWRKALDTLVQEEIQRLNSRIINPEIHYSKEISSLETELNALIEEINTAQIYAQKLNNNRLTLPNCQKFLEQIIEQLQDTLRHVKDFQTLFPWQRNWLNQSALSQKVITALAKVNPRDWTVAFDSWYFYQTMYKYYTDEMPRDNKSLLLFEELYGQLMEKMPAQIQFVQKEIQRQSLKEYKRNNRKKYDLLFTKKKKDKISSIPFAELMGNNLDIITDFLPVLFTTLPVAQDLSTPQNHYFDYVIFLETNQFEHEEALLVAKAGKRISIFSNPYLYNDFSLSELAKNNGAPVITLQNFYESNYTPQLINQTSEEIKTGVVIENTEGRFKDKDGVNEIEAQQVLKLLHQIKARPTRTLPSVGIVTFTKAQRDSISSYLLSIKQKQGENADKIRQLERNGMGVFFVEEIYGLEFDILIVSLTFGATTAKGSLGKKINYLYSPTGTKAIKLLVSKSNKKTFLINSIPKESLIEFSERPHNDGAFYLTHLLGYAEAQKMNDPELAEYHKQVLWNIEATPEENSIFLQEIQRLLRSYFEQGKVQKQTTQEGFKLPLSVLSLDKKDSTVIIQPDIFFAKTPYTSFDWEIKYRKKLEKAGFIIEPIWSVDCWKNAEQAARKLASKIIRNYK